MHDEKNINPWLNFADKNPKTFAVLAFVGSPIAFIWGIGGSVSAFTEAVAQFKTST